MTSAVRIRAQSDVAILGAAFLHGALTLAALGLAQGESLLGRALIGTLLGVAMCWGANTVSHIHLHRPLFQSPTANRWFSIYLSVLLTVPQRWWKVRHLAHHGIESSDEHSNARRWLDVESALEIALIVLVLASVAIFRPALFATVLLPALVVGYGLCALQGYEEHARAAEGVDHHGRVYNLLWFNDGYHAAHHRSPGAHWAELVTDVRPTDVVSHWPPILRMIEGMPGAWNRAVGFVLDGLEGIAMHVQVARNFQLRRHARAFAELLSPDTRPHLRKVTVIGGGLYPRSVLVLGQLLPTAHFTIIDRDRTHLEQAKVFLSEARLLDRVTFQDKTYAPSSNAPCDLMIVPLAFRGDRSHFYTDAPAPWVATHDWLWHRRGHASAIVSVFLAKRINLSGRTPAKTPSR